MAEIQRIGVIGAGTMGSGIAQVAAAAGFDVRLYDVAESALQRGLTNVQTSLERFVRSGRLDQAGATAALSRIQSTLKLGDLADVECVIEAASEDLELKRRLFAQLDQICAPTALLASNTSSLSITAMAAATSRSAWSGCTSSTRHP